MTQSFCGDVADLLGDDRLSALLDFLAGRQDGVLPLFQHLQLRVDLFHVQLQNLVE
jgi:hypothetical protein